jgi:hypothetical protein
MSFTSKRGRPLAANKLKVIEGGRQESLDANQRKLRINREPIDIYYDKGLIDDSAHWAGLHFRWLYTLKFGAPGISAIDIDRENGRAPALHDPLWQEEREKEYAMAVEKLRNLGALKIVLNIAVFGHFPKYMQIGRPTRKDYTRNNLNEVLKLREGLEVLASHWGKKP